MAKKKRDKKIGRIIIISGPSQVGKDAVGKRLLRRRSLRLYKVVTYTTREKRPEEKAGRDHFFITPSKFKELIKQGKLLEWAPVRDRLFGTPKQAVAQALKEGKNVLLKIDVRGAKQVLKVYPKAVTIFIKPDKLSSIKRRMREKGFSPQQLKVRWQEAMAELKAAEKYDYQVINREGKLNETVSQIAAIIKRLDEI